MPERANWNAEGWGTESSENVLYWPFEVLSTELQTEQQQKELRFLETAFGLGFRPCLWHGEYRAISPTGREVWVIWRGRRQQEGPMRWEVRLFAGKHRLETFFWLDDFDSVSTAGLNWLQGSDFADILPLVHSHVVKGPRFEESPSQSNKEEGNDQG